MMILNCPVSAVLWEHWSNHFSPPAQPFYVSDFLAQQIHGLPRWSRAEFLALQLPLTLTDTFKDYAVSSDAPWVLLLDELTYNTLGSALQKALLEEQQVYGRGLIEPLHEWQSHLPTLSELFSSAAPHQLFVWWPSLWHRLPLWARHAVVLKFITTDRLSHRGGELTNEHWTRIERHLPGVRPLAGTFAPDSGPNCLATTLAAFGVRNVGGLWLHSGPFERWLQTMAVQSDTVDELGTILVWRNAQEQVQHAAVALGGNWLFHKEAQSWSAPRQIVPLSQALERWAEDGWQVSTYVLHPHEESGHR
jgi:hypothetical protein